MLLRAGANKAFERDYARRRWRVRYVQVVPEPQVGALPDVTSLGTAEFIGSNEGCNTITQGVPRLRLIVARLGSVGIRLANAEGFFSSSPDRQLRVIKAFIPGGNVGAKVVLLNAVHCLNGGLPII